MDRIELKLELERETKNKVRYKCIEDDDAKGIEMLYIVKAAIGRPFPQTIKAVVEEG